MMKATVMASAIHARSVRADAMLLLNPPVGRFGLLAMNDFEEIVEVSAPGRLAGRAIDTYHECGVLAPSPNSCPPETEVVARLLAGKARRILRHLGDRAATLHPARRTRGMSRSTPRLIRAEFDP
jgi:hypothetical protein